MSKPLTLFILIALCSLNLVKGTAQTQEDIVQEEEQLEDLNNSDFSFSVTETEAIAPIDPKTTIPIDRRRNLTYTEFMTEYLVPRKPVILQGEMDKWEALKWDPEWFAKTFPDTTCDAQIGNSEKRRKVKIGNFVEYLRANQDNIPMYCEWDTAQLGTKVSDLMRQMEIPKFFANDWFVGCTGQFHDLPNVKITPRALYFGGKRSGIHNHVDNLNTWVFSYQLAGRKRWKLHDPNQGPFMYDSRADLFRPDYEKYPLLRYARGYDFVLEKGEILFWPVGYWHATYVLEEVSIGW